MRGPEDVQVETREFGESDPMMDQAEAFVASISGGPTPAVGGVEAVRALKTVTKIEELIKESK